MIFVFGSNLAGAHGAGAALEARRNFGALDGQGDGPMNRCYAIPTKDENIQTLPLDRIKAYVKDFIEYAKLHPKKEFFVTAIGCGLAGYQPTDIAPMFKDSPLNCTLHRRLVGVLK